MYTKLADGRELRFYFHHEILAPKKKVTRITMSSYDLSINTPKRNFTQAVILLVDKNDRKKGEVLAEGFSYVHPKDNFNKDEGRKRALARALKELTEKGVINHKDKIEIWRTYFSKTPQDLVMFESQFKGNTRQELIHTK